MKDIRLDLFDSFQNRSEVVEKKNWVCDVSKFEKSIGITKESFEKWISKIFADSLEAVGLVDW